MYIVYMYQWYSIYIYIHTHTYIRFISISIDHCRNLEVYKWCRSILPWRPFDGKLGPPMLQPQVVAAKHMDTVAVTFRESAENQVLYLDEAKGQQPVAYEGQLDAGSLDQWLKELLTKSEPGPLEPDIGKYREMGRQRAPLSAKLLGSRLWKSCFLTCLQEDESKNEAKMLHVNAFRWLVPRPRNPFQRGIRCTSMVPS